MLDDNYNATFTMTRKTRSGSEDGTPTYSDSTVVVEGWFDELEVRAYDESSRDQSIAFADRRALFMCDATADIQLDDVGNMVVNVWDGSTNDRGRYEVSQIRTAPTPEGAGHLELQLQGAKETR